MKTIKNLSYRPIKASDIDTICKLPQNAEELFFMFPKAKYPLTRDQLESAINHRLDSTAILYNEEIAGFANFYEKEENSYCSIGNVIITPKFRNKGIGTFLVQIMEKIAFEKYNITEMHISCFNTNTKGILLYSKLGYIPYDIEIRVNSQGESLALIKFKKIL